jgi:starvation-inducible outer membrane lipoprotein
MKTKVIFIASLALLLSGCVVVPVNLSYESARMLDKGQIQLQGSYSRYNAVKDTEYLKSTHLE